MSDIDWEPIVDEVTALLEDDAEEVPDDVQYDDRYRAAKDLLKQFWLEDDDEYVGIARKLLRIIAAERAVAEEQRVFRRLERGFELAARLGRAFVRRLVA